MSNKKLVIALGGNALGNTPEEQLELVKETASTNLKRHTRAMNLCGL